MANRTQPTIVGALFTSFILTSMVSAQSRQPYPNAVTDQLIHRETPMLPPPRNVVFTDPDFGSAMVRATDETTNFKAPGTFLVSAGSGYANEWSNDNKKFYVLGRGGQVLVFGFDPSTMAVGSLPQAESGQAFLLPLRGGASFSFIDPDLIYGTADPDTLTIVSYRFSTGVSTPVIDTRTCGLQPALGSGPHVVSDDDVSVSEDENRISISEGGPDFGEDMFVVVYDRVLGCRWYNTQTGQIGGQWGPSGTATVGTDYLIRHARLSRSGNYIRIMTDALAWYVWDLETLNVVSCPLDCGGYGALGYNSFFNAPGKIDDMYMVKRPLSDLSQVTPLLSPLPSTGWGEDNHFSWNNVDVSDSAPVCASTYSYDGDWTVEEPFVGEVLCIETDGLASTIWRFAHDRAVFIKPYYHTQPLGTVSADGSFYLFDSDWDAQLGIGTDGTPRSDVFIVKLK
jgi:hypothetical protein